MPIARTSTKGNDVQRGKATRAIDKTFKSLLEERHHMLVFPEYSVFVIEAKMN